MIDQKEGETELSVKIHYDDLVSVTVMLLLMNYFYIFMGATETQQCPKLG
jgi:hypothetical protein